MTYWAEEKDPSDVDFWEVEVDAAWLGAATIASQTATVTSGPDGLVVGNIASQSNIVRIQLSAGNVGTHAIEVTVTTSDGRTRQKTFYLVVREK